MMPVALLMVTIVGLLLAGVMLVISLAVKKLWLAKCILGGATIWIVLYGTLLLGFSVASRDRALGVGDAKEFCGFYLDCHMHVALTSVRTTDKIGDLRADGKFYVVGLRVFSDAKNPNIAFRLLEPRALIEVNDHTVIDRDLAAEALLPSAGVDLGNEIKGRETIEKEIVFDIPNDITAPELHVAEGYGVDSALEAVLIDDEDSIGHARAYFMLGPDIHANR